MVGRGHPCAWACRKESFVVPDTLGQYQIGPMHLVKCRSGTTRSRYQIDRYPRRPGRHTVHTIPYIHTYDICVVFRFVVPVRGFMIIFIISGIVPWPPTFVTVLFDRYSNPHAQRTYARADLLQQSYCPQFCALCASSREPRQHSHTDRDALSFGDLHVAHATRLSRQQSRRS